MKNKSLARILAQFHDILEEQRRLIKESNIGERDFLAAVERYQQDRTIARFKDANAYRKSLACHCLTAAEIDGMVARFSKSRNDPPRIFNPAVMNYAANLERAKKLQLDTRLSAENFADAYRSYLGGRWWESNKDKYVDLKFGQADTPEKLFAMYKKHGVFWWWQMQSRKVKVVKKIKGVEKSEDVLLWDTIMIRVRAIQKGTVFHPLSAAFKFRYVRSAYMYELSARLKPQKLEFEFGKPWWFLNENQRELLARRWPAKKGESYRYAMRRPSCPEPGWHSLTLPPDASFNFNLGDDDIAKALIPLIKSRRKELGIKSAGNKGRGVSWERLELIDRQRCENEKLSPSERSRVSKARKASLLAPGN